MVLSQRHPLAALLLLVPLSGCGRSYTDEELADATARQKALYFLRDFDEAQKEGREWRGRAAGALKYRAWDLQNRAAVAEDPIIAGDWDAVLSEAEQMVEQHPESPWSWFALAGVLNWKGERGEDALDASEKALALAPDDVDILFVRANALRLFDTNQAAVDFLEGLPPEVQRDPQLLTAKATALSYLSREENDPARQEQAMAIFGELREADSLNLEAHYFPGRWLVARRRAAEARPLLQTAAALSPAYTVHRAYWQAVQGLGPQEASPEDKRAEIEADVQSLLQARGQTEGALHTVASVYGDLQLEEKQREFEDRLLQRYPDGQAAEWVLVDRYRAVYKDLYEEKQQTGSEDPEKKDRYRQMLVDFIDRPHHVQERLLGDAYRQLFYVLRDDDDVDGDELYEAVDGMVQYEGINPHVIYGQGAIALAEHHTHLEDAERLAQEGLVEARKKIDEQNERGVYDTEGEYEEGMNWYTSIMYDALGWVYFHQDRLEDAEEQLLHAYDLYHKSPTTANHIGQLYEALHDRAPELSPEAEAYLDDAEEFYIKGLMAESMGDNPNEESLQALYEKRHGSSDGFETYLANAAEMDRSRRRGEVLESRIASPEPILPFALRALGGPTRSTDDLAGKVAVINMWGIWCGPCVAEMPEFQKFHERYRNDRDVVVLTINNDRNPDEIAPWMEEKGYDFAVLLDDGYLDKTDMHLFPTTWFLDRQGRMVFQKEGWSEALEEEFGWRVEAIRGSDQ